jgi:hypothetical protein
VSDIDRDIRELLAQRADDIPAHRTVPRTLARRARRRIALNAVAAGTVAVAMAVGAFTGVRALTAGGPPVPIATPSPTSRQTPPAAPTGPCASGQLRAVASIEGAAGSRQGAITVTNTSDQTCTLQGDASVELFDQGLNPITAGVVFGATQASWQIEGSSQPPGWPVVTLSQGESASVRISWSNWCPDGRAVPLWRLDIPNGGNLDVTGFEAAGPPPCNGPGLPSTIDLGPFEPTP